MKTGIYQIKNKVNQKVYIGQAVNIHERWKGHVYCLNTNRHDNSYLQRSWNKYGQDNFEFEILQECKPDDLNDLEMRFIREFNSYTGFENSKGYNMTLGGDGCARISSTVIFNNKVYTIHEATSIYGDSIQTLQNYLNCVTTMPKRYYDAGFRYEGDNETEYALRKNSMHERVICGNVTYKTISECCNYYEIDYNTMLAWLDGRRYMPQKFLDLNLRYESIESKTKIKPKIQVRGNYVYCDGKLYRNLKIFSLCSKIPYGVLKKWMKRPNINSDTLKEFLKNGLRYVSSDEAISMGIHIVNHDDLRNMGLSEDDLSQGTGHKDTKYKPFKVTDISTNKEYIFESKKDYIRNSETIMGMKPTTMGTIKKYQALKKPYGNLLFEVLDQLKYNKKE